ncbi:maleylacetoacetate isomerase [Oceanicella actignis]|uniref:Maleylpyruvate isomerase n=1 Tax=Oceanicella actignis TaxID=1189325 RepID=A0A1M7SAG7_9RHOB|nr:maleylacetoacetate isomerase [Oceanicella actignis]TYO91558.1 maleylpyruvate isomerase [Oceanicella actignis]SET29480.1 maleylpyruvate isomerase [Oceanicella actignis]SHN55476.1 maleylpyruvate isomerase [Oceanicella actignis]
MTELILHSYFRSSTSTRLRAALNLKGLEARYVAHHLVRDEHRDPAFLAINPQGLLPALELRGAPGGDVALTQSLAIIEWLDETWPDPPLLPADPLGRARVRALSQAIACEVHAVNNLRVLRRLREQFGADDAAVAAWFRHWVAETLAPLERMLRDDPRTGAFCHGDAPGMADLCLYAQVLNNRRFDVNMAPYPTIMRIFDACEAVPEIARAAPANQPDAE